jgi:membrane fusion protein (multidrug efflux system)
MKNIKTILVVVLVLAVLVFVKIKFLTSENPQGSAQQQGKPQITIVTAYVAKSEKLENKIFVTGTVLANEEVMLATEMPGKVISVNFTEGSKVSKGDLLLKINDADLQAQLKKLKLQEKLASDNEAREKKLLEVSGISQMEYDGALTQLNSFRADIELIQAQIAKTEIRAPFNGTIGLKKVSEGSYVSQTTQIASLEQTDPLKIDFFIPEKYSSLVNVNDTLGFSIEGNEEHHTAKVMAIEPKVDMNTRTLQVRAITPNKSGKIFPGSFARIDFSLEGSENSILIPTEAIIPILKGQKVFVSKNGKAEEVIVQTGFRTDTKIQVLKGIQAGDTVITTGIMQLKKDGALKIISVK